MIFSQVEKLPFPVFLCNWEYKGERSEGKCIFGFLEGMKVGKEDYRETGQARAVIEGEPDIRLGEKMEIKINGEWTEFEAVEKKAVGNPDGSVNHCSFKLEKRG